MARGKSRLIVGLFVVTGFVLAVAAVVWLGASNYFESGSFYVTYFDESVQGLQVDSRVKYRGVDVGKVQGIGVAPDHKLVQVVIKIDLAGEADQYTFAQLRAAGITGIVFIELDQRTAEDDVLLPAPALKPPYPVIPSKLSQSVQLLQGVDRIMTKIGDVDFKGISDQIKEVTQAAEQLLAGPALGRILTNVDSTTATLDRTLRRIDAFLADRPVAGLMEESRAAVGETRQGISEARELLRELRREVAGLETGALTERAERLLEDIDRRTRGMSMEADETAEEFRLAVDGLKELIERLKANPSDLLFSQPHGDEPQRGGIR